MSASKFSIKPEIVAIKLPQIPSGECSPFADRAVGRGLRSAALLSIFDGGLRRAQVAQARAEFDNSAANYRSTVVSAFQQVEDSLASLNHYHDAALEEKAAVDAAQRTLDLSLALYKQGAVDYLTVVTSQTALLQTQLESLNLDTVQLRASVDLIRALGGGWEDSAQKKNGVTIAATVAPAKEIP